METYLVNFVYFDSRGFLIMAFITFKIISTFVVVEGFKDIIIAC